MTQIWKYPIKTTDSQYVFMPEGAEILTVQMQDEVPCIWAIVDPENEKIPRYLRIFGTGHNIKESIGKLSYVGTYQINEQNLVFHIFEKL